MPEVNQVGKNPSENVGELLRSSLYDEDDDLSVINMLPEGEFKIAFLALEWTKGQFFFKSDIMLRKWADPSESDHRLRLSFWDEYNLCQRNKRKMNMSRAFRGVVSGDYLRKKVYCDQKKMVFILTPPENYALAMRTILNTGLERFKEILALDLVDKKTGRPNNAVINAVIKVTEIVDQRVKGAVVQRMLVDQRSTNMNMNVNAADSKMDLSKMSLVELESLEKRVGRIEKKAEGLLPIEDRAIRQLNPDSRQLVKPGEGEEVIDIGGEETE